MARLAAEHAMTKRHEAPPGELVPAEDQSDDDWDGWDEPPPLDLAA